MAVNMHNTVTHSLADLMIPNRFCHANLDGRENHVSFPTIKGSDSN